MNKTKEIIGDVSCYSLLILLTQFITVVAAIIMRRFLGPVQVGVWAFIQVVLTYSEYANLGTVAAVGLEIPFYNGKGQTHKAENIKNTVFSFSVVTTLLVSAGILAYAFLHRQALSEEMFYGFLFAAGLVLLQKINGFLVTLLRAYKHFTLAGKQMFYSAVVNAVLIGTLSYSFKLYGFMLAMCLSFLFNIGYILRSASFSFRFRMDYQGLWALVTYGFPLMLISLLGTFFETIDRLMITKFIGLEPLGYYSIALMTYTYINGIPNSIGIVVIPNIQEQYGRNENRRDLKGFLRKAQLGMTVLIPVLIGLGWFLVPYFVRLILPKFVPGIYSVHLLILGAYFLALAQIYSQFVYVVRKHMALLPIVAVSCIIAVLLNWIMIRRNLSIEGVALATTAAMFCNFTMIYAYASRYIYSWKEMLSGYLWIMVKFLWLVAVLFLIGRYVRAGNSALLTVVAQTAVFLAVYLPFLMQINREFGLVAMVRNKFKK